MCNFHPSKITYFVVQECLQAIILEESNFPWMVHGTEISEGISKPYLSKTIQ